MQPERAGPILIVEDNQVNLLILRTMLRRQGFEPLVATDGVEAIEMAARHAPGLILMDLNLPQLGGMAAAAAIRQGGSAAALVAVTADAGDEVRASCLAAGFADVLAKPIVLEELAAVVRTCLGLTQAA